MAMDVKETVRTHHVDDSNPYEIVSKAVEDEFRSGSPSSPRLHALLEVRVSGRLLAQCQRWK